MDYNLDYILSQINHDIRFHLHTDYSNPNGYLDSCTKYTDYVKQAKKEGMKGIAFSEHGNIFDWVLKKKECDKQGIKYIHGNEGYMCTSLEENQRGFHIGLYSKNWKGVKELNSLVSISTSKGDKEDLSDRHFYSNPRLSIDEIMNTSDDIIITTACLASFLWKSTVKEEYIELRDKFLQFLSDNKHRCFLEVQYHDCDDQKEYNKLLIGWNKQYNIPLIAGTDTHSINEYKAECRTILQKSRSKNGELSYEDNLDLTWKNREELVKAFINQGVLNEQQIIDSINNTGLFCDMCDDWDFDRSFKYPNLYEDAKQKWWNMIWKDYENKKSIGALDPFKYKEYEYKIKEEFEAMSGQDMQSFMMFMGEMVKYCQENNIPYGKCRGSVGGSTIAYITDITDVDPVRWNTVFSRFCNSSRVSLADIDIDFAPEDRKLVYEYIIKRFTLPKASFIAQFGTEKTRGSIDTLARGLNYEDLDKVKEIKNTFDGLIYKYSKIIQQEVNLEELEPREARSVDFEYHDIYINIIRNKEFLNNANNLKSEFDKLIEENQDLFYYFDGIRGTITSKGNHPAGMIGSPITLYDNLGIWYKKGDNKVPVSQCAMKGVDYLNFVKFDILGLKTVGILKDCRKYYGCNWKKSHEINWNDEKVWNNMTRTRVGVFQFEGDYAFSLLKKFRPNKIKDMSLVNAALRPSGKSYRNNLIERKFNKNPSEQIDELLKDNQGYLVFQEDTIKFLTDICGFDGATADLTRRAIGKKDEKLLKEQLPKILEGYCNNSNKPRLEAEQEAKQFIQIIEDSSEYQFGDNHSTGYSMNGYECVLERTYHTLEFCTAYLNRAEDEEDNKMGLDLCHEFNIEVNPARFRYSKEEYAFDRDTNSIYKGISSIKELSIEAGKFLWKLKDEKYNNFFELLSVLKKKGSPINKTKLEVLIKLDFFIEFGNVNFLLECVEMFELLKHGNVKRINKDKLVNFKFPHGIIIRNCKPLKEGGIQYVIKEDNTILSEVYEWLEIQDFEELKLQDKLKYQQEYLGYINYKTGKIEDRFKLYVNSLRPLHTKKNNRIWAYSVNVMSLASGKDINVTIKNPYFDKHSLEVGDIIKTLARNLGKDDRGYWHLKFYEKLVDFDD